jgi:N-acetylglutamate synthase-like GNAT family acetyltransferase
VSPHPPPIPHVAADVEIGPATDADMPFIREHIERAQLDDEGLDADQFVTLRRDGALVAFGRVKPYAHTYELGGLFTLESERGKGHAARIIRELIRVFPQDDVYLTADLQSGMPAYYERLGFRRTDDLPAELQEKCDRIRARGNLDVIGMVHRR